MTVVVLVAARIEGQIQGRQDACGYGVADLGD